MSQASRLLPFQPMSMTTAQLAAVSFLARYAGHTHELGVSHQAAIKRYGSSVKQPSLISLAEAADILGVSRQAVSKLVHDGLLVAMKAGRSDAVVRADVQRLAQREKQVP
ncbi:MAG: helix-turn-helix domain-containing protein [Actinomycetota bacterium]|nr:helix-turn-helix domain-containing protein [Actinomycetota bacterium]